MFVLLLVCLVFLIVAKNVEVKNNYKIPNIIEVYQFKLQGGFES